MTWQYGESGYTGPYLRTQNSRKPHDYLCPVEEKMANEDLTGIYARFTKRKEASLNTMNDDECNIQGGSVSSKRI